MNIVLGILALIVCLGATTAWIRKYQQYQAKEKAKEDQ